MRYMKKRETIFVIQGYDIFDQTTGAMKDVTTYELYANSASEAIKRAESLCKKKGYRIQGVIEK